MSKEEKATAVATPEGAKVVIDGKEIKGKESVTVKGKDITVDGKLVQKDGAFVKTGDTVEDNKKEG